MKLLKQYCCFFFLFGFVILLLQNQACTKEYSFEGAKVDTTRTDTTDTLPSLPPATLSQCALCKSSDSLTLGQWSFTTGNVYVCGTFSNSGFFAGGDKTAFTFFGPSACSVDTGIVVSVYLSVPLDRDRYNISTTNTAFYYYDHNGTTDIFQSHASSIFSVTVSSYIYATHIVTGTFNGIVYKANGDTAHISDGRFMAPLH
jgi:hypothetical protein